MKQIHFKTNMPEQDYCVTVCDFDRDASSFDFVFLDLERRLVNRRVFIITDSRTAELYLDFLAGTLSTLNITPIPIIIPYGEQAKSLEHYANICAALIEHGCTRSDFIINLGGGVVEDTGGFAAATFMRGIKYINMPTSLLSMVDSSMGGKTGVDFHGTKNILGAFHQPAAVYINIGFLKSLPECEFHSGMGEIIKYAAIDGIDLMNGITSLVDINEDIIARCCQIKRDHVCEDVLDNGRRRILNLGHSFGHAFEAASDFSLSHGAAVGLGLLATAEFGEKLGINSGSVIEALKRMLSRFDMPVDHSKYDNVAFEHIMHDKKACGTMLDMIFIHDFGQPFRRSMPLERIKEFLAHE